MTKEDAEQHAAVWRLAGKLVIADWERHKDTGVELVAATLANSNLAEAMAQSYETMAKAIKE